MEYSVNKIIFVKVIEKEIIVTESRPAIKDIIEMNRHGISTYRMKVGSKEQEHLQAIPVEEEKIQSFFDYLYDFARHATEQEALMNDCTHEVQFVYSHAHKEIFTLPVYKGHESMLEKIKQFVDSCKSKK